LSQSSNPKGTFIFHPGFASLKLALFPAPFFSQPGNRAVGTNFFIEDLKTDFLMQWLQVTPR